jgi:hypothetical protein
VSANLADQREDTIARLAASREQLRRLFEPEEQAAQDSPGNGGGGRFPRSRIMRALASNRGLKAAAVIGGGLLLSRPALALRLLRMIPVGAVARTVFFKLVTRVGTKT